MSNFQAKLAFFQNAAAQQMNHQAQNPQSNRTSFIRNQQNINNIEQNSNSNNNNKPPIIGQKQSSFMAKVNFFQQGAQMPSMLPQINDNKRKNDNLNYHHQQHNDRIMHTIINDKKQNSEFSISQQHNDRAAQQTFGAVNALNQYNENVQQPVLINENKQHNDRMLHNFINEHQQHNESILPKINNIRAKENIPQQTIEEVKPQQPSQPKLSFKDRIAMVASLKQPMGQYDYTKKRTGIQQQSVNEPQPTFPDPQSVQIHPPQMPDNSNGTHLPALGNGGPRRPFRRPPTIPQP